jgi:RNA polymerase sigma-70 factor (sigma-E family)
MDTDTASAPFPRGVPGGRGTADAAGAVTALYQAHAVGMIRLALIMVGDRGAAEDVVQEAFFGLYRGWGRLTDSERALTYVRSSVLNGCRNVLRQRSRNERRERAAAAEGGPTAFSQPGNVAESAEAAALIGQEHQQVLDAIRTLPSRQREALVLRFYLDMSEDEAARAMGVSKGTVKSATSRAVAAVGRLLQEEES